MGRRDAQPVDTERIKRELFEIAGEDDLEVIEFVRRRPMECAFGALAAGVLIGAFPRTRKAVVDMLLGAFESMH